MSLNTLNIKQKQGGRVVKQADRSSTFKFALQDSNGALINLNGQEANISLFNPNIKKYWSTKAKVKDAEVEFKLPGNIEENDYVLEISVGGYVFPSDNEFVIEVVKGFKDLPDMETGLRYSKTLEEISQEYINKSDNKLKENLDGITDQRVKIDKANAEILKNINNTGNKYINDINTNYTNVKLEFDKNAQQRKDEFKTIADNDLKTLKETSSTALNNIKNTGDGYVNNITTNYTNAKNEFNRNVSQKNTDLKNNYDTYMSNMGNKLDDFNTNYQTKVTSTNQKADDVITLIGSKKEEALKEIDGQVKIATDKYLNDYSKKLNDKVDKVVGKDLSDNNYTNQDKAKVDSIKDPWELKQFKTFCFNNFNKEFMEDKSENWSDIPSGYYYVKKGEIENQPTDFGLMRIFNMGDYFDIIWETVYDGNIFRKSGIKNSISEWTMVGGNRAGALFANFNKKAIPDITKGEGVTVEKEILNDNLKVQSRGGKFFTKFYFTLSIPANSTGYLYLDVENLSDTKLEIKNNGFIINNNERTSVFVDSKKSYRYLNKVTSRGSYDFCQIQFLATGSSDNDVRVLIYNLGFYDSNPFYGVSKRYFGQNYEGRYMSGDVNNLANYDWIKISK